MSSSPLAAVIGMGGAQNRAIAGELSSRGVRVRGISRAAKVNTPENIEFVSAATDNRAELTEALKGAEIVVITSPIDHRPGVRERLIENVVEAAAKAGAARLVFNTAGPVYADRSHPVAKVLGALSDAVLAGPVPAIVLQPTVYMDNVLAPWSLPTLINDGVLAYPMPEHAPVSWISHRSLGEFVHAAATKPFAGRIFEIGGPEALTSLEFTDVLSTVIHRPVAYHRLPLPAFAEGINAAFGAPAGDDIAALYLTLETNPEVMMRTPSAWADLDVTPETFSAWALRQTWPAKG